MNRLSLCSFCLIILSTLHEPTKSESFTSTAVLEELVETESALIDALETYIKFQEEKLNAVKRRAKTYKERHNKASENVDLDVSNPLDAYKLIKRLKIDWKEVETLLKSDVSARYLTKMNKIRKSMKFPSDKDLNDAAVGLMILQETYNLNTSSLAKGEIKAVKYSAEFSASDCLELGKQLHGSGDYDYARLWLNEAASRLNEKVGGASEKVEIEKYLASMAFDKSKSPSIISMSTILRFLEGSIISSKQRDMFGSVISLFSSTFYGTKSETRKTGELERRRKRIAGFLQSEKLTHLNEKQMEELFNRLCRGENSPPLRAISALKCRFLRRKNPFLVIAPFKIEEAHREPDILIFHDIISDLEIATIKNLFEPSPTAFGVSNVRTAKLSTVRNTKDKHIETVSRRISDITGLTMTTSEDLTVINYGIGGGYETHFHFSKNISKILDARIASVLFYMSDVTDGGATVFPLLNVTVWPKKGSGVFWHDLHSSGNGDNLSLHGECPVLIGSKWVASKWIRE